MTKKLCLFLAALALASCDGTSRPCTPGPNTICSVVGSGTAGIDGDMGPAWAADIYLPMDMVVAPNGDLIVVDWNNHRLRRVHDPLAATSEITTCVGTGLLGDGPPGPVLDVGFNHPTDITYDDSGRLWIAAWHNSRIRRVDPTMTTLEDIAGTGARAYSGDSGPAATAAFDLPTGIDLDAAGNVYVVDQANQVLRRIAPDGTVTRVAGQCITNECAVGETPTACPGSDKLACGTAADRCALPCRPAYGGDGGPALEARFAMPFGQAADPAGRLVVAPDGTIYLADSHNHRIRRITPDGMVDTYAGTGTRGFSGDGGPAVMAQLNNPVDVELAPDGTLYIADTENSCVRAIAPDHTIRTVAGVCGTRGFSGDGGSPLSARLDRPYGIEIDAAGNLWIADTHNQRIRVVTPAH